MSFLNTQVQLKLIQITLVVLLLSVVSQHSIADQIELISPAQGDILLNDSLVIIKWKNAVPELSIRLEYSIVADTAWYPIASDINASDESYRWTPQTSLRNKACLLRITQYSKSKYLKVNNLNKLTHTSDYPFSQTEWMPDGKSILQTYTNLPKPNEDTVRRNIIEVRDINTNSVIDSLQGTNFYPRLTVMSPSGKFVAVVTHFYTISGTPPERRFVGEIIVVYQTAPLKELYFIYGSGYNGFSSIAWDAKEEYIVAGTLAGRIIFYSFGSRTESSSKKFNSGTITDISISPDRDKIFCLMNETPTLISLLTLDTIRTFSKKFGSVVRTVWTDNSTVKTLVNSSYELYLREYPSEKTLFTIINAQCEAWDIANKLLICKSSEVANGHSFYTRSYFDDSKGILISKYPWRELSSLRISPDGKSFLGSYRNQVADIYQIESNKYQKSFGNVTGSLAQSTEDNKLIEYSDTRADVWDVNTKTLERRIFFDFQATGKIQPIPDSRMYFIHSEDSIRVLDYDFKTINPVLKFRGFAYPQSLNSIILTSKESGIKSWNYTSNTFTTLVDSQYTQNNYILRAYLYNLNTKCLTNKGMITLPDLKHRFKPLQPIADPEKMFFSSVFPGVVSIKFTPGYGSEVIAQNYDDSTETDYSGANSESPHSALWSTIDSVFLVWDAYNYVIVYKYPHGIAHDNVIRFYWNGNVETLSQVNTLNAFQFTEAQWTKSGNVIGVVNPRGSILTYSINGYSTHTLHRPIFFIEDTGKPMILSESTNCDSLVFSITTSHKGTQIVLQQSKSRNVLLDLIKASSTIATYSIRLRNKYDSGYAVIDIHSSIPNSKWTYIKPVASYVATIVRTAQGLRLVSNHEIDSVLWMLDGKELHFSTGAELVTNTSGFYTVRAFLSKDKCLAQVQQPYDFTASIETDDTVVGSQVTYDKNTNTVMLPVKDINYCQFELFDSIGRTVLSKSISAIEHSIKIESLQHGVYFIVLRNTVGNFDFYSIYVE